MLTQITDLPFGVIGFRGSGRITAEDYESELIPVTEAELALGQKLRLLLVFGEDFEGYDLSAVWDDTAYGFRHFFDFERIAIVSDHGVLSALASGFGMLIPAQVRSFPVAREAEARAWLAEGAGQRPVPREEG